MARSVRPLHIDQLVPGDDADFLHLACLNYRHDRPDFRRRARDLLEEDPALGSRDIWSAACMGNIETVRRMLDGNPSLVNARGGWFSWEPLLYAAYSRVEAPGGSTLETARLLIERGADPNACYLWGGDYRFTALTGAFGEGEQGRANQPAHPEWEAMPRLLLDAGADPNDGQALYNRMFGSCNRCLEILLEYGLNRRHRVNWRSGKGRMLDYQLAWAVRKHHVARAKLLVEHGAGANRLSAVTLMADLGFDLEQGTFGAPLHVAAVHGHLEMVELLVGRGVDVSATDPEGRTARDWAEWWGEQKCELYLSHCKLWFTK